MLHFFSHCSQWMFGKSAKLYLMLASFLLLMAFLGTHDLWTQEHRWADIVQGMFYNHDFLHPRLNGLDYYDKPLLSYWLMAVLAFFDGGVSTWTLRLPSVLAGILALVSIVQIGTYLKDKTLGILSGWMLLTTFYFVFWARVSSADMLNLAGSLYAISWYMTKRNSTAFFNYTVFFTILALTGLCKGLVGPLVAMLAIVPDLLHDHQWRKHLNGRMLCALLPACILYFLPFELSALFSRGDYQENGLYLVYRENIVRYFHPFDHKGPIYLYLIDFPLYLLPWTIFFIPAMMSLKRRWCLLSHPMKWMVISTILIFSFFTLSGSRRNYYILPLVPFGILIAAEWILSQKELCQTYYHLGIAIILISFSFLFLNFNVLQPIYYANTGLRPFVNSIQQAIPQKQRASWHIVLLDADVKLRFYLNLPVEMQTVTGIDDLRDAKSAYIDLHKRWAILNNKPADTIFVTRKKYAVILLDDFKNYQIITMNVCVLPRLFPCHDEESPIAFIPRYHT